MYAEFILKIRGPPSSRLYQVMFDFGWISYSGTLDPIPVYGYCIHNLGTI